MKKIIGILSALLCFQLVIIAVQQMEQQNVVAKSLVAGDLTPADKLIFNDENHQITMTKTDGKWLLPDGLPADSKKVNQLIQQISQWQVRYPSATTDEAKQRFKVAKDKFVKHIQIYQGSTPLADIFVGISPRFKKANVRLANDDAIYLVAFDQYQQTAEHNQWLDKKLLALSDVTAASMQSHNLVLKDKQWQISQSDDKLDQTKWQKYLDYWQQLTVDKLAEKSITAADFTISLTSKGKTYQYQLQKQDEHYLIKRDDIKQSFEISATDYEQLVLNNWNSYVLTPDKKTTPSADKNSEQSENTK